MSAPRATDQQRADPVTHREKASARVENSRQNHPPAKPATTAHAEGGSEHTSMDSRRQEIVLNIPQQPRDDDEKTEKSDVISCAASSAQLDVATRDDGGVDVNKSTVRTAIDTTAEDPIHRVMFATENNKTEMLPADSSSATKPDSHAVDVDVHEDITTASAMAAPTDDIVDEEFDIRTVPDVDNEIEAVFRAQQPHGGAGGGAGGVIELKQPALDYEVARRNGEAMVDVELVAADGAGDVHSVSDVNGAVLRGKTCTPASQYTEVSEIKYIGDDR